MNNFTIHFFKNIFLREPLFIIKYYLHKRKDIRNIDYILMVDGKMPHGGLFDRLKGAVSIYALSKAHKKEFRFLFTEPFCIENYLEPNHYDWRVTNDEIIYSYPLSKPIIAYSEIRNPRRLLKARKGQTHYYFGGDILEVINQNNGLNFEWASLFNELFKPSRFLIKYIDKERERIDSDYLAIHLRFLNLLGDKVERVSTIVLDEQQRNNLIKKCVDDIVSIISEHLGEQLKTVVFSDSMSFLEIVKKTIPNIYVIPGVVKHIDIVGGVSKDESIKVFVDMYMMAGAQKVYSIVEEDMYPSAFPQYSAKIGNKPFKRIGQN